VGRRGRKEREVRSAPKSGKGGKCSLNEAPTETLWVAKPSRQSLVSSRSFRRWCRRQRIRPRFGAVGEYGSLAVIERFMRSLKAECTRRLLVPLQLDAMREEIAL